MKLKRAPLILLAIAVLGGVGVYFYEQGAPQRQEAQEQAKQVFLFKEDEVQAFMLKTPQHTLSFAKVIAEPVPSPQKSDQKSDQKSGQKSGQTGQKADSSPFPSPAAPLVWRITAPTNQPANEGSVAFLLNLMATAKSEKTLKVDASKQAEFGFDQPLATVDVTLKDQKRHRLVLGKPDFNRSYLYAQADPPEKPDAKLSVLLLPMEFENAVNRPQSEWESKP